MAVIAEVTLRGVTRSSTTPSGSGTGWLEHAGRRARAPDLVGGRGLPQPRRLGERGGVRRVRRAAARPGDGRAGGDVTPEVTFHPAHEVFPPPPVS